jgi:hypothetical protein
MGKSQEPTVPAKSNFDLLLEHLPEHDLAAALVTAHINRGATSSIDAMRQVMNDRLATLKVAHVECSDQ